MAVKPLSALGPSISALGDAAAREAFSATQDATRVLRTIVVSHGSRYHIKGRNGNPVKLSAYADVRDFKTSAGRTVFTGKVVGVPEGFWSIVEYGRSGGYIIARKGAVKGGKGGRLRNALKAFEEGTLGSGSKPIRTPYGPRQWVIGGPAGPIGHPWESAMRQAKQPVPATIADRVFVAMVRAWK